MSVPLVFMHGWGLNGGVWDALIASLPDRTCHAPDLPGHGGSPRVTPYSVAALADRLAESIPEREAVILVGWSMGGLVALEWAATRPDRVQGLVLIGATPAFVRRDDWPHGMASEVFDEFARSLAQDWHATLLRFLALQARGGESARQVIGRLRETLFAHGEPAPEALAAGLELLRTTDLRPRIAAVRCPALIVQGGHDTLCPPAAAEWLATNLANARLALLPHAAHAPFLSHPEEFATQLMEFIDGLG